MARDRERWLKDVMIIGGTGTFGNALCEYLIETEEAGNILIFSRDEDKQFHMKNRLREKYPNFDRLFFCIGDVRDRDALCYWMKGADVVFHSAALKHVPSGEIYPDEVIKTNVIGAQNVIYAADQNCVRRIVNLSSDKSVQPVNAYGMTKGLSEKLVAAHKGNCAGVSLRYGNVMASRGSVIPLFVEQIKSGKKVTITNKDMTRFLLPKEQAIDLAMYCASANGLVGGSVVVIESPACTVESLVEALYFNFNPDIPMEKYPSLLKSGKVTEIGIRHGEKIHETLVTSEEMMRSVLKLHNGIPIRVIYPDISSYKEAFPEYMSSGSSPEHQKELTSENTHRFNSVETYNYLIKHNVL